MKSFRLFSILALICAAIALASCNTVGGVGKDVQKLGRGLEKASE